MTTSACLRASGTTRRAASMGSVILESVGCALPFSVKPTKAMRSGLSPALRGDVDDVHLELIERFQNPVVFDAHVGPDEAVRVGVAGQRVAAVNDENRDAAGFLL